MDYSFFTCDVFTKTRFGGNPLAVVPNATGLTSQQMQLIAREFNYSESTFVFPAQHDQRRKVRIFTPTQEVPFAGHPNIGTAFALAHSGEFGKVDAGINVVFEEKAGEVPITIREIDGNIWCELKAPETLSIGPEIPLELVAAALSLSPEDIITNTHRPQLASVGLPFIMVELKDRAALENVRSYLPAFEEIQQLGIGPDIHVYTLDGGEFDLRTRMFAPLDGIQEDPATGSANCALTAMLTHYQPERAGQYTWQIAQGIEMNRPSILDARTEKQGGEVAGVWIAGYSVMVSKGQLQLG